MANGYSAISDIIGDIYECLTAKYAEAETNKNETGLKRRLLSYFINTKAPIANPQGATDELWNAIDKAAQITGKRMKSSLNNTANQKIVAVGNGSAIGDFIQQEFEKDISKLLRIFELKLTRSLTGNIRYSSLTLSSQFPDAYPFQLYALSQNFGNNINPDGSRQSDYVEDGKEWADKLRLAHFWNWVDKKVTKDKKTFLRYLLQKNTNSLESQKNKSIFITRASSTEKTTTIEVALPSVLQALTLGKTKVERVGNDNEFIRHFMVDRIDVATYATEDKESTRKKSDGTVINSQIYWSFHDWAANEFTKAGKPKAKTDISGAFKLVRGFEERFAAQIEKLL